MELSNKKHGVIMRNKVGYVKDNHPQKKPKKLLDLTNKEAGRR